MAQTSSTENAKKLLKDGFVVKNDLHNWNKMAEYISQLLNEVLRRYGNAGKVNDDDDDDDDNVFAKNFVKLKSELKLKIFNIMINCAIEIFEIVKSSGKIVKVEIVKSSEKIVKVEIVDSDSDSDSKIKIKTEKVDIDELDCELAIYYIMTCLIIALKMYGAYDWIKDENIIPSIAKFVDSEFKFKLDRRILKYLVGYILEITDWKGCESYKLEKNYDTDFIDEKHPVQVVDAEGNIIAPIVVDHIVVDPDAYKSIVDEHWDSLDYFLKSNVEQIVKDTPVEFTKEQITEYVLSEEQVKQYIKYIEKYIKENCAGYQQDLKSSELFASIKDFLIQLELFYEKVHEKVANYVEYPEKRRQHFDIDSRINSFISKSIFKILDSKLLDIIVRKHVEKRISDGRYTSDKIKDYENNGKKSIAYQSSLGILKRMSKSSLSKSSLFRSTLKKKSKRSRSIKKKSKRSPLSKSIKKK